jgi:hypothetical protein
MKAIQVKYLRPTNTKPSRWKAFAEGKLQIILSYDHALSSEENARKAAQALIDKRKWNVRIGGSGGLPNGDYVFTIFTLRNDEAQHVNSAS